MAIAWLWHQQIDKIQWDALVTQSEQGQVYALSWYLDVVAPQWEAVVELDVQGKYKTIMPVPWHRKLGMKYVQQPLFCQQLGMYSLSGSIDPEVAAQFIAAVQQRFRYVSGYQFNTDNSTLLPDYQSTEYTITLYLSLNRPYEQIAAGYTRDRRMNLKRAQKAQHQLEPSDDLEPLLQFFKNETAGEIYGGVSETAYEQLHQLYLQLKARGLAQLFYTSDADGRKNAGCLFIVWRNRIVYIFNAASAQGRKLNGRTLILNHIIRKYAGQNYIFDFESPGEEEADIVHFYKSFGAEVVPIPVLQYNRLPKVVRLVREWRMQLVRLI